MFLHAYVMRSLSPGIQETDRQRRNMKKLIAAINMTIDGFCPAIIEESNPNLIIFRLSYINHNVV